MDKHQTPNLINAVEMFFWVDDLETDQHPPGELIGYRVDPNDLTREQLLEVLADLTREQLISAFDGERPLELDWRVICRRPDGTYTLTPHMFDNQHLWRRDATIRKMPGSKYEVLEVKSLSHNRAA